MWYTLSEEEDLLEEAGATLQVEVDLLGESVNGNPVQRVRIGNPPPEPGRRTVFLTGCVHGNEPAGRQALLNFIESLSVAGPYLSLTGNSGDVASTPDDPVLDITGDIDLRIDLASSAIGASDGLRYLITKYTTTGDERAYAFRLNSSGLPQLAFSDDGVNVIQRTATASPSSRVNPRTDRLALRVTLVVDNGEGEHEVQFFTGPSVDGPWTQLGDTVTNAGTTSINNSNADLIIGAIDGGTSGLFPAAQVYAAQVRDGVDGAVVADARFEKVATGATGFTDEAGLSWTVSGSASVDSDLTSGQLDFIAEHGFIIIPTVNPDGFNAGTRRNANNVDLNRDFMALLAQESRMVAEAMGRSRPVLMVDLHESVNIIDPANDIEVNAGRPAQAHQLMKDNGVELRDQMLARATTEGWPNGVFGANVRGAIEILDINSALRHCTSCIVETNFSDDSEPGREHRLEMQEAMIEEIFDYVVSTNPIEDLIQDSEDAAVAKAAEGSAGSESFDLREGGTLDPPPLAYDLTSSQVNAASFHINVFNMTLTSGTRVLMGQSAQPFIPYVFDPDSPYRTVSGERVFDLSTEPPPEEENGVPPVAQARIRERVVWLGCRLVDGRIISGIPGITGEVSRVLGDVTTSGLILPIPISGPESLPIGLVEQLTEPGRTMIVAVVNDIPTWAGIVGISEGGTDPTMMLPVASLEAYLDRRIVRTHEFNQVDEALIAATLVGDAGDIPGVGSGIGLKIDAPPTGTLRDRQYLITDRKTVLEALQELMGVIDGPEWTIDLDWTDETHTAIDKIFRVRKRIGEASSSPNAVFTAVFGSQEASEARYSYRIDYTIGHGANYVVAYSSGQGEDQPSSDPAIDTELLDSGFPIYEQHFQPSSNISEKETLNEHALAELDRRARGTRTFRLEARWDAYPRYGVDWKIGDDIAWDLKGHRHPQGIRGHGRVIGFKLDMQARVIRPILEEDRNGE